MTCLYCECAYQNRFSQEEYIVCVNSSALSYLFSITFVLLVCASGKHCVYSPDAKTSIEHIYYDHMLVVLFD